MANVKVTYDELSTVASQLTTGKGQLEDQLTQLKGLVDNLIAEGFVTDTASGAFGASYAEFDNGTRSVLNGLDGLSQFLTRAADQFQQTDSSLASSLGN